MARTLKRAERLWTVADVAAWASLHPRTVYRMAERGVLPHMRIGGALRFDPEILRAHFARRAHKAK